MSVIFDKGKQEYCDYVYIYTCMKAQSVERWFWGVEFLLNNYPLQLL